MEKGFIQIERRPGEELVVRLQAPEFKKFPTAARGHMLAAGKETLLTLRSLLDAAIESMEKAETKSATKKQRRTKIEVE